MDDAYIVKMRAANHQRYRSKVTGTDGGEEPSRREGRRAKFVGLSTLLPVCNGHGRTITASSSTTLAEGPPLRPEEAAWRGSGGNDGSGADRGKRRSRSKVSCKASGKSTLVHGSPITRLSHAGHASFTRWPVKRRRMANEARATITDGGPRHTVRLG
jgi:hypothetical protein